MNPRPIQFWIFLRGLTRESAHWHDFPEKFTHALPGVKAISLDLPGNGRHFHHRTPSSPAKLVEHLRNDFHRQIAPEVPSNGHRTPVFLFSISLGAMIAVQWAEQYPEEINGAVLINTSLPGASSWYHRLSPLAALSILRCSLERDPRAREARILRLTSQNHAADEKILEVHARLGREHPVSRGNLLRQIMLGLRFRLPKEPPRVPFLLLNSLGDALVHPRCSLDLKGRWGSELRTHPTAGHDLPLDDPEWTISAVKAWLASR